MKCPILILDILDLFDLPADTFCFQINLIYSIYLILLIFLDRGLVHHHHRILNLLDPLGSTECTWVLNFVDLLQLPNFLNLLDLFNWLHLFTLRNILSHYEIFLVEWNVMIKNNALIPSPTQPGGNRSGIFRGRTGSAPGPTWDSIWRIWARIHMSPLFICGCESVLGRDKMRDLQCCIPWRHKLTWKDI